MSGASAELAAFLAGAEPEDGLRGSASALIAETAAGAALGVHDSDASAVFAAVDPATDGRATPLGRAERISVPAAAMLTGVAADRAGGEPGRRALRAVAAGAIAVTEDRGEPGANLVEAVAVGAEVALRLEGALGAAYAHRGWDPTGAAGSVGTAAACARLIGLPHEVVGQVLGVAATQAAGLRAGRATTAWAVHVGKAAANGVEATLLCEAGFTGPRRGIEGRRGLLAVAAPEADPAVLTRDLGRRWLLRDVGVPASAVPAIGDVVDALAASECSITKLVETCARVAGTAVARL